MTSLFHAIQWPLVREQVSEQVCLVDTFWSLFRMIVAGHPASSARSIQLGRRVPSSAICWAPATLSQSTAIVNPGVVGSRHPPVSYRVAIV